MTKSEQVVSHHIKISVKNLCKPQQPISRLTRSAGDIRIEPSLESRWREEVRAIAEGMRCF